MLSAARTTTRRYHQKKYTLEVRRNGRGVKGENISDLGRSESGEDPDEVCLT